MRPWSAMGSRFRSAIGWSTDMSLDSAPVRTAQDLATSLRHKLVRRQGRVRLGAKRTDLRQHRDWSPVPTWGRNRGPLPADTDFRQS
jgi:hypothetical protein